MMRSKTLPETAKIVATVVEPVGRLRLFGVLMLAGLSGCASVLTLVVPQLAPNSLQAGHLATLLFVQGIQLSVLLSIACWLGIILTPKLGLGAPLITALLTGRNWQIPLRRQIVTASFGGVIGASILILLAQWTPTSLTLAQGASNQFPILARILYGGITEELLLRWGMMSTLMWIFWRLRGRMSEPPRWPIVALSIACSAILFGAGHLPAAAALAGKVSSEIFLYVVLGNAAFGFVAGYLFWRFGIECAVIAHALTHLFVAGLGF